jgi:hypothetical protein
VVDAGDGVIVVIGGCNVVDTVVVVVSSVDAFSFVILVGLVACLLLRKW